MQSVKLLLSNREILAVILKETVDEYKEYSREEIIGFIEPDSIESDREVSPGGQTHRCRELRRNLRF